MRIVCLILPRFYKTHERLAGVLNSWYGEYLDIIRDAQARCGDWERLYGGEESSQNDAI